jgi:hypothetical protein
VLLSASFSTQNPAAPAQLNYLILGSLMLKGYLATSNLKSRIFAFKREFKILEF